MAIFSKKKNSKEAKPKMVIAKAVVKVGIPGIGVQFTLKPRVTEKATLLAENNVYIFDVPQNATKGEVKTAVATLFKVHPIKVATVRTVGKVKISRGKKGRTSSTKKAYVY
ncbi:MAG: 50S ribosomal protein L23, partial [bacterium]|nr:50S ribosomal protein L23 [bacterium]